MAILEGTVKDALSQSQGHGDLELHSMFHFSFNLRGERCVLSSCNRLGR